MGSEDSLPDCEQLALALHDERLKIPWEGRSPRELTAAYKTFILKAQAAKSTSDFVDPEQIDFWLPGEKAPWAYQGAPLLSEPRRT